MAGTVPQDYDFVVTDKDPTLNFFDYGVKDGDAVRVELNGQTLRNRIDLNEESNPTPVPTNLRAGKNTLKITALNVGTRTDNTVAVAFPKDTVIYDKDGSGNYKSSSSGRFFYPLPRAGASFELDFGLPLIRVDRNAYPEAAQHVLDRYVGEGPAIVTLDRPNAETRRRKKYRQLCNCQWR